MRSGRLRRLKVQRDLEVMRAMCGSGSLLTSECEAVPWMLPAGPLRRWGRNEPVAPEDKTDGTATPRREQDAEF